MIKSLKADLARRAVRRFSAVIAPDEGAPRSVDPDRLAS
jgi:hypothetical protein